MKRRLGVGLGVVAIIIALVIWKWPGGSTPVVDGSGSSAAKPPIAVVATTAGRKLPDPKTLARGSIAGTITDEKRTPIAGARVCVMGTSDQFAEELLREPFCADTDAQGGYTVANLLPAKYSVTAAGKTFRPTIHRPAGDRKQPNLRLATGEHKTGVDIALHAGGVEITGVVSDVTGGPIAKARVRSNGGLWGDTDAVTTTETDEHGKFSLWLAPGRPELTASAEGYSDRRESGPAPGTFEIMLTPESSLSGVVVDAGTDKPVEGARVMVGLEDAHDDSADTYSTLTDANGAFRITRLTPGRHYATAHTERGHGQLEGSILVGLSHHVEGVVVKLFPASRISGTVVIAGTKAMCPDASVTFRDRYRGGSTRADPDGTLVAEGVLPGNYTVSVSCAGYNEHDTYDPIVVSVGKDVSGLVWEVDSGATVRGKVITKAGEPVQHATISAYTAGLGARAKSDSGDATSARDGSYELTGLKPGSYQLDVFADHHSAPAGGFKLDVVANTTVMKDLALEVRDTGTVRGTVVDSAGKPVAGVSVTAQSTIGDGDSIGGDDVSDDAGAFTLDQVPAGDYNVTASRGDRDSPTDESKPASTTVRIDQTSTVRLVVAVHSGTIAGSVIDADGKPIADAFVSAVRESDGDTSAVRQVRWDQRPLITSTEGGFKLVKLAPGAYTIRAFRKGGGEAIAEHVAIGSTTTLRIKAAGSLTGVARRDGPAIDELVVKLVDVASGFDRLEMFYKTDGRFTIRDVPKGHFTLTVETSGSQKRIELDLADGETKTGILLTLDALVTLTGRVVELYSHKPVAGIRIMAQPVAGGDKTFGHDGENVSDEAGRFTLENAPSGTLQISASDTPLVNDKYTFLSVVRQVDRSGTIDIGDIPVMNRIKRGDPRGVLGVDFFGYALDTPPDKRELKVRSINPAGPAANTGLAVGDVVITISGVDITGLNARNAYTLMGAPPGTTLVLGLLRGVSVPIILAAP